MDKIIIRKAEEEDLQQVQQLDRELFESDSRFDAFLDTSWPDTEKEKKTLLKAIQGRNGACYLAESSGEIIGYITFNLLHEGWRKVKQAAVRNIFVKQGYRGSGVGRKLMAEFEKWSRLKKVRRGVVQMYFHNKQAEMFYKSNGFSPRITSLEIEF